MPRRDSSLVRTCTSRRTRPRRRSGSAWKGSKRYPEHPELERLYFAAGQVYFTAGRSRRGGGILETRTRARSRVRRGAFRARNPVRKHGPRRPRQGCLPCRSFSVGNPIRRRPPPPGKAWSASPPADGRCSRTAAVLAVFAAAGCREAGPPEKRATSRWHAAATGSSRPASSTSPRHPASLSDTQTGRPRTSTSRKPQAEGACSGISTATASSTSTWSTAAGLWRKTGGNRCTTPSTTTPAAGDSRR